jgi:tetratricopeptide (TPR) repeat protein
MGASGFSQAAHHHGWGFHNNAWVNHSHWHNHYPNHWHHGYWGWWRPIGYWPGWRLWAGYGYGGYGYGGYGYYNPYYTQSVYGPLYYDYSQPLPAEPTDANSVTDPNAQSAMGQFNNAQAQFKRGDAAGALQNVDVAIRSAPSDTRLHEFRALALFSLGRYNEAAETLYPVLAAGPGWDWDTVWSLYPSYDAYTKNLRELEAHVKAHPDAAAPRFLAAYHHLVVGHMSSAKRDLSEVVRLQPQDKLAQALLDALNKQESGTGATSASPTPIGTSAITAPMPKAEPIPSVPRSANVVPTPPEPRVE